MDAVPASYLEAHRYDGAAIEHGRRERVEYCALQPRDLAIVRDVWRYKFLTAAPATGAVVARCVRPGRRPTATQALPRRPPRPLPPLRTTRHRLLPVDLPPRRRRPPPPPARRRHPRPPALQAPNDHRLQPRPARHPAQRLDPRLPPSPRRRSARLGRRNHDRPARWAPPRARTIRRRLVTGGTADDRPRAVCPDAILEIVGDTPSAASRLIFDRVRPHPPPRQELRQVPPLRRLPHLVVAPHPAR